MRIYMYTWRVRIIIIIIICTAQYAAAAVPITYVGIRYCKSARNNNMSYRGRCGDGRGRIFRSAEQSNFNEPNNAARGVCTHTRTRSVFSSEPVEKRVMTTHSYRENLHEMCSMYVCPRE